MNSIKINPNMHNVTATSAGNGYYFSQPQKRAWAHLNFAIKQGNGILLLSGPQGCGKTTFVQMFAAKLSNNGYQVVNISASSSFDKMPDADGQVLVVVDDAEQLNSTQLASISDNITLANSQLQCLQFLLVGSDKFDQGIVGEKLQDLRKQVVFSYQLGLMNSEDTIKYAQLQLETRGYQIDKDIAKNLFANLFEYTAGSPLLINKCLEQVIAANNYKVFQQAPETDNQIHSVADPDTDTGDATIFEQQIHPHAQKSFGVKTIVLSYLGSIVIAVIVYHSATFTNSNLFSTDQDILSRNDVSQPLKTLATDTVPQPELIPSSQLPDNTPDESKKRFKSATPVQSIAINEDVEVKDTKPVVKKEARAPEKNKAIKTIKPQKKSNPGLVPAGAPTAVAAIAPASPAANVIESGHAQSSGFAVDENQTIADDLDVKLVNSNGKLASKYKKSFDQEFSPVLDKIQLNRLVAEFEVAYQFGDVKKLDDLFLETVKSNNINGKKSLKAEYQKLFNITQSRNISIFDVNWKSEGNTISGQGGFKVTITERGSAQRSVYSGTIILKALEKNHSILFSELFYNYDNI